MIGIYVPVSIYRIKWHCMKSNINVSRTGGGAYTEDGAIWMWKDCGQGPIITEAF